MLSGYQFMLVDLFMIIFVLLCHRKIDSILISGCLVLFYLAFISSVAYTLWAILLKYYTVSNVTIYGFANSIFGVILSGIFYKKHHKLFL